MKDEVIADAKAARDAGEDPLDGFDDEDEFDDEEDEQSSLEQVGGVVLG